MAMATLKKALPLCIALLGISLLLNGSYMQAKAWLAQYLIESAWQHALLTPNEKVRPWFYADGYVTAQLNWPTQQQRLTILAGASGRNLAFAPGHFLPSGELSSDNGVLIAGHNDTHFAFLKNVKVGESFSMQLQNGQVVHYQVRSVRVIHQHEQAFLMQPGLYLLTCYPFDSLASGTELRLLVSADKLSSSTSILSS